MLEVNVRNNQIFFGDGSYEDFSLNFQRTLRIPEDGKTYPLPPGLGNFPVCRVEDYRDTVPQSWLKHGGVFIPMYQREALWIRFNSRSRRWKPNALKVAVGKINAVSGKPWNQQLQPTEKDYLVSPPQPWLDGINAGKGFVKQFVAMPLGMGYTVEGQVTGKEEFGGIQIIVYEPKPGKFRNPRYSNYDSAWDSLESFSAEAVPRRRASKSAEMGIAAGGKMKQKIYPDPHGIDTWDENDYGRVYVHIVNSMMYREITGKEPPATPITAKTYAQYKLPWYDLYDENLSDISASDELSQVKTVKEMEEQDYWNPLQDDDSVDIHGSPIYTQTVKSPYKVTDGDW